MGCTYMPDAVLSCCSTGLEQWEHVHAARSATADIFPDVVELRKPALQERKKRLGLFCPVSSKFANGASCTKGRSKLS